MRRPIFSVAILAIVSVATLGGQSRGGRPGTAASPTVIAAERFDVSPPLRDIPAVVDPGGPARELPRHPHKGRRGAHDPHGASEAPVQDTFGGSPAPATLQSIEGINNIDAVLPPDTNGDVGPNHYVQWVNLSFAIYSKGTDATPPALLYGPVPGRTLWSGFGGPCELRNDGDPIVLYDHLADRWFMSQFAIPNSFLGILFGPFYHCIAISATPDPTGPYYRYQFALEKLGDYPKFGVWPDGYYMTVNQFEEITLQFAGQGVAAFERDRMLAGQPASMIYFDMAAADATLGGMLPSDLDGPAPPPGTPNYFLQVDDDAWGVPQDRLQLWGFEVNWNAPSSSSFTRLALIPTMPFDSDMCGYERSCIPQPGTAARVDAISDRLMYRLQYRNFGDYDTLVANHTIDVDGTDHAGIRWYEIRNPGTVPQIFQQGTYAPDVLHRWMASAALDRFGNLGLGFSAASGLVWPSIRYTGRLAADPPNLLTQGEGEIIAGSGSQTHTASRWGDYSMLAVDPVDDCTFWYTQEYYAVTSEVGWQTRIGTFRFPSCDEPSALPVVTATATTPRAAEAGPTSGVITITRGGDTSAPLTVRYTVSGTAVADGDYPALPGTVTIPAGSASVDISVTPVDDFALESDESVVLTLGSDAAYRVGSPGAGIVTIVSDDLPPDLVVAAVTAPATGGADADLVVTDTTKNQGNGIAPAASTAFYLSTNNSFDGADVFLGSRTVPVLAPGAADSRSTAVRIPPTTTAGSYYVLAKADWDGAVAESLETNNVRASGVVKIGPDLVISVVSAPSAVAAGAAFTVSDTTANQGGGSATGSATYFYLSANTAWDGADVMLGGRSVAALGAGASETAQTAVVLPAATAAGTYYVIARADSASTVAETAETNNTRTTLAIKAGPDLVVTALAAPPSAAAGGTVTVTDTTANQGAGPALSSSTGFYLSANTTIGPTAAFLGSRLAGELGAGQATAGSTLLHVPAGTTAGNYYVIAAADWSNGIAETSETNNRRVSGVIRIGADLVLSSLSVSATARAGGPVVVTETTKNQGGGPVAESVTGFYLSVNTSVGSTAVFLGSRTVAPLGPAGTETASTTLTIPAGTAPGTYYVIGVADWNNVIPEVSENNNARASGTMRVGPDLIVTTLTGPASASAGTSISASDTIRNQGGDTAPASMTRFYLSTNGSLDPGDAVLGGRAVPSLGPGATDTGATALAIPASTAAGSYYIIAKADGDEATAEALENNNTRAKAISIAAAPAP